MNAALARNTDPATSHQAAFAFDPESLKTRILLALAVFRYGATTHEIADYLRESLVSVSPRMRPLVNAGKIRDSGLRNRAPGRSPRIVWELVP